MGLADTAKSLQKEQEAKISRELKFLRHCRKFCNAITVNSINRKNDRLCQLYTIGTAEAMQEARKLQGDMVEAAARLNLYKSIIEKTEAAEKEEKGGWEKYAVQHYDEWMAVLRVIRKETDEIRQLPFDAKEGENDNKG